MEESLGTEFALGKLITLQKLQSESAELSLKLDRIPVELEKLDQTLKESYEVVVTAEASITDSGKQRRQLEGEVEDLRRKLSHYKGQLMEVKTNDAYQAMLTEISFVEKKILEKEDEILDQMLSADELDQQLKKARELYASQKVQIETRQAELKESAARSEARLAELQAEVESVEAEVPAEFMQRYQRIASARGGVAMAKVINHSCEACHVRLRPQLLAEIRSNRQLILCENCSRILYYMTS